MGNVAAVAAAVEVVAAVVVVAAAVGSVAGEWLTVAE
jgi:hypothetical protein